MGARHHSARLCTLFAARCQPHSRTAPAFVTCALTRRRRCTTTPLGRTPDTSHRSALAALKTSLKHEKPNGQAFDFADLKGRVVLVVNTASKCGFTPQYTGLEKLYQTYKDRGLMVIGFPCNQFGGQEPGKDEEIASFCQLNHGVSFPLMKKSDVNGEHTNDVFKFLKERKSGLLGLTRIKWNFEKFLIDQNGEVVQRYGSISTPESIAKDIEKLLTGKSAPGTPKLDDAAAS